MEPPISALFLVEFDQRVGYTIAWDRAAPGIDLNGVEYQCLPSGLHSVRQDIVYFIHGSYAGISAFVQADADASQRNARFVAVGALVPLTYGRLGRSWLHAPGLRQLGSQVMANAQKTDMLEEYWKKHRLNNEHHQTSSRKSSSAASARTKRAVSDAATSLIREESLTSDHPALSVFELFDLFGPLLYPLHRAALLRKRILLLGQAPVKPTCDLVYNLSVLSSLPSTLDGCLLPEKDALSRILPLFSIGISDIPQLSTRSSESGWIACTTDDILAEKNQLYDLLVRLPPKENRSGQHRKWPVIQNANGTILKATQRDWRRYQVLHAEIARLKIAKDLLHGRDVSAAEENNNDDDTDMIHRPLLRDHRAVAATVELPEVPDGDGRLIEPATWGAMMYEGFMWWASAGEEYAWAEEEARGDRQLLDDLPDIQQALSHCTQATYPKGSDKRGVSQILAAQETATVLTVYFHRIANQLLQTMADIAEHAGDDRSDGTRVQMVTVSAADMRAMNLDGWSDQGQDFVRAGMALYFDRAAHVENTGVRLCGVRVC